MISKCVVEVNPIAAKHVARVFDDFYRAARIDLNGVASAKKYGRKEYWIAKNRELITCLANDASLGREVNERALRTLKTI
jgi:hypothetical protein